MKKSNKVFFIVGLLDRVALFARSIKAKLFAFDCSYAVQVKPGKTGSQVFGLQLDRGSIANPVFINGHAGAAQLYAYPCKCSGDCRDP